MNLNVKWWWGNDRIIYEMVEVRCRLEKERKQRLQSLFPKTAKILDFRTLRQPLKAKTPVSGSN